MDLQNLGYNFDIALEAMKQNRLRSFLTSLGIIFGVASVISMLAIGRGAQEEVLDQMKLLGTNNIIVQPVVEQKEGNVEETGSNVPSESNSKKFSPGLTLQDLEAIQEKVPYVETATPEIIYDTQIIRAGRMRTGKIIGVSDEYFDINESSFELGENFTDKQVEESLPVAIIGSGIRAKFFSGDDPIGKRIKAGKVWFRVAGVLEEKRISDQQIENLGIRDYNMDIYAPATSVLLRYGNRSVVTGDDVGGGGESTTRFFGRGFAISRSSSGVTSGDGNTNEVDRLIVRVEDNQYSIAVSEIMSRMLKRRHNDVVDFEIIVPELLLEQEQRTKNIFNIVLAAIASISLIVGGIGIMNIMLASVIERYREIGVRRAVGAQQKDIRMQFLTEALTICFVGGFIGIILGIVLSLVIQWFAGIQTIVTLASILISFGVASLIGVVFGYVPAKRASEQDVVVALRYE
ncbi:MAG: ABC transporter permease [Balneolaceae bacterium]|nr:ABC transporter permease [Balneolaceae bacterium]MDR9446879.1 ABC transporter permease [Balneolaceae bacterium]